MNERLGHRRDVLSTATRVGLGLLMATAWLTGAGGVSSQQEVPFQNLGPATTATAPNKGPHSIFETKPVATYPAISVMGK